ncbi:TlpA family protein disulfide reductase [Nocardioides sp.]|uniref:Putative redoxin n=1 Tax=metagenome TaxID=256318 RepID=A0A2P2BX44_9ZZZZ
MTVALTLLLALPLTACASGAQSTSTALGVGAIEQIAPKDRKSVARITGRLLDGGTYDSAQNNGEVVVYNLWGSWCAPCRKEAPILAKVAAEYLNDGVRFVGVNVRDNDDAAKAFERKFGIDYPSLTTGSSSQALLAFGNALPPNAVPITLIVDRSGKLAARIIGVTTYVTLSALVTDAAGEVAIP